MHECLSWLLCLFLFFFARVMNAYAQTNNVSASSFRLVTAEGDRMSGDKPLSHYNVQDGDQLDVVIEQTGGRRH